MTSPKDPVGITLIPQPGQDVVPIYQDPNGLLTFAQDAPYLAKDGRSLMEPMPVIEVGQPIWQDINGNAVQAVAVTELPSGDGPSDPFITNLLDFWTNDQHLSEYTTQFNVTGPNLVLEMFFLYDEERPFFTINHGGDTFEVVQSTFNPETKMGCLIATCVSARAEISSLHVTATGGTFGGIFGRIRELDYPPKVVWSDSRYGRDSSYHNLVCPEVGELVGACMWMGGYRDSGKFYELTMQARSDILDGVEISYTTTPMDTAWWTQVADGVYEVDSQRPSVPRVLFEFVFDEHAPSPIYWDFGITATPGYVTFSGIGNAVQNNNWVDGEVYGANITQEQGRYNQYYTGARFSGWGKARVGNFKFYHSVTPYHCAIHRSRGVSETRFRNSYPNPWVALIACLKDARDDDTEEIDGWRDFTLNVGERDGYIGYSMGEGANTPFGNISRQPNSNPLHKMVALYMPIDGGPVHAVFFGDLTKTSGLMYLSCDGETIAPTSIRVEGDKTFIEFEPLAMKLMVDSNYRISIYLVPGGL